MFGKEHEAKATLQKWGLHFSDNVLHKRTNEGQTLLKSFYVREDKQIVKLMSAILLESADALGARDIIMSDIYEMFKDSE